MPRPLRNLLAALVLGLALPSAGVGSSAPPPSSHPPRQTAALQALERAIARCDALLARDDDAQHLAATKAALDELKKRGDAIRATFDQSKYDELRVDLNLAYQRLAAWMAPPVTGAPTAEKGPVLEIPVFQLDPSPSDASEVRAALAALEREIKRQEERNKTLPEGPPRDLARVRLEAVKRAQSELSKDFTRGRWDAVLNQLKR